MRCGAGSVLMISHGAWNSVGNREYDRSLEAIARNKKHGKTLDSHDVTELGEGVSSCIPLFVPALYLMYLSSVVVGGCVYI